MLVWSAIPPLTAAPFCRNCQPLTSHSHLCKLLLTFTAPIYGWLLYSFLLRHPLLNPLSAAPIIGALNAGCHADLFSICTILFFDCPPSSFNSGHLKCHHFQPLHPVGPSCSLVWLSLIRSGWLLHCIASHHRLLSTSSSACCLTAAFCCPP